MACDYECTYRERVRYADCDLHAHLNNARYFTFMEQARVGYLLAIGMRPESRRESIPFILVHARCDFRVSALLNDEIDIALGVTRFGNSSFTLGYRLQRVADGVVLAEGETVQAWFDYTTMRAVPVPLSFREAVQALKRARGLPPV
ncbi:MAG: acyl-CoA thioesterase [Deltaproteobacteria bacterium]|nr:acyl-CoA thioesterase [Deltaproteobacteria bacterium]